MALTEEDAQALVELGLTPRAQRVLTHQRYADATVYDGRPDFFADSDTPITGRKPCVVYNCTQNAIRALCSMTLGDGRFPAISSGASEDERAFDERLGLGDDESKDLDAGIAKIVEQTDLESVARDLLGRAMGAGSTAVLACIIRGELRLFAMDARTTTPEFEADDPETVTRVTESYRYVVRMQNPLTHQWEPHVYQYRRVIDERLDVTYLPVEVKQKNEFPTPSAEDPKKKWKHDFGFCPVVWYAYDRSSSTTSDFDGRPIHDGKAGLIDAVNLGLSQRHRAAIYCGDPTVTETGVEDDELRIPVTSARAQAETDADRMARGWSTAMGGGRAGGASVVRKKGAGVVWRYVSPDAKVQLLTLPGDALKALTDNVEDNIRLLREALGFVYIAPEDVTGSGDISGKTLLVSRMPEIQACNRIRNEVWRKLLVPLISMLLRIVMKVEKGLYLAGDKKIREIVKRFEQETEAADGAKKTLWFAPHLTPAWGDYFEPSDLDEQTRVANAVAAKTGGLITLETAVEHVKGVFPGIRNVAAYLETLKEEADERQAALHASMLALGAAAADDDDDAVKDEKTGGGTEDDDRAGTPKGKQEGKGPPGAGARGAPPAPPKAGRTRRAGGGKPAKGAAQPRG